MTMTFDYTRSVKIDTAKRSKPQRELRYLIQLFERDETEENMREAELDRLRFRVSRESSEMTR